MQLVKIGMANINNWVGGCNYNLTKAIRYAQQMADEECTFGVFQEQLLGGYPAEDLSQWEDFVEEQIMSLVDFAEWTSEFDFKTIFILGLTISYHGNLYNCAAVVHDGEILGIVPKEKLPDYGIFDEGRIFAEGIPGRVEYITLNSEHTGIPFGDLVFAAPSVTFGVEVCEDVWSADGPMRRRSYSGAELIFNISASPWRAGVVDTRREMLPTRSADNQVTLVYVNQYGGQDSLVFDGGGYIYQNGRPICTLERWQEHVTYQVINLHTTRRIRSENTTWRRDYTEYHRQHELLSTVISFPELAVGNYQYPTPSVKNFFLPEATQPINPRKLYFDDLIAAMKTGLAGYMEKTGFEKIGISSSGGKDSALTLLIAWLYAHDRFRNLDEDELREKMSQFIYTFSMPTSYNSDTTKSIAQEMAEELGVSFREIPIQEAFEREIEATKHMLGNQEITPITVQNIQARIRGSRMWNWTNSTPGSIWLQTSNMSEKSVGYTTTGGDMMGGYSLIGNLPKTVVIALLENIASVYPFNSLKRLLQTKASAELAENQEDERDLMPFSVLDSCFYLYAGEKVDKEDLTSILTSMWADEYSPDTLSAWAEKFLRLFHGSIFKWVQAPQAVHLGSVDLDRERALQLPVVQSRRL